MENKVTLTINGRTLETEAGSTVLRTALANGIHIPHYCWHPGLSVAGNCRMCLVEIEGIPKLQTACSTAVRDGMVVRSDTDRVKTAVRHVLEFLLINHPVDCPVCDQAGECGLQEYYMMVGRYDSRFAENKVTKHKKATPIGPWVMLDQERCILCSRCVRFTREISKSHEMAIFQRGDHCEIDVFPGQQLDNPYSANVIDVCPVGALTCRDFRYQCRVWYLKRTPSVCPGCSRGCSIEIHHSPIRPQKGKGRRVFRFKPRYNPEVNHWWLCDAGRYGYKAIDEGRLRACAVAENGGRREVYNSEAVTALREALRGAEARRTAYLVSPDSTNEELFAARKLFRDTLNIRCWLPDIGVRTGNEDDFLIRQDKHPNTRGAMAIFGLSEADLMPAAEIASRATAEQISLLLVNRHDLAESVLAELKSTGCRLVYLGTNVSRTSAAASLTIALASFAEMEGTFTNFEGRVQRIRLAVPLSGQSEPEWAVLDKLAQQLGLNLNFTSPGQIFGLIRQEVVAFGPLDFHAIPPTGVTIAHE